VALFFLGECHGFAIGLLFLADIQNPKILFNKPVIPEDHSTDSKTPNFFMVRTGSK
jgi:hypothetical protein